MKTLIYRNSANSTRVEVQVDIFATVAEMQLAGFETRFTNMHITDTPAAIAMGINVNEIEEGFGAAKAMAEGIVGIGLFVIENSVAIDTTKVAQIDTVSLAGTSGTANVNIDATDYLATFTTDLDTSADNFVTSHAAALDAAGITVTHPNADGVLVFTAKVVGVSFYTIADIENVSGDLDGALANATLNQSGNGEVTIVAP